MPLRMTSKSPRLKASDRTMVGIIRPPKLAPAPNPFRLARSPTKKTRPNPCIQNGRDHRRGLDAKKSKTLQPAERYFRLTSPFIEPFPPGFPSKIGVTKEANLGYADS